MAFLAYFYAPFLRFIASKLTRIDVHNYSHSHSVTTTPQSSSILSITRISSRPACADLYPDCERRAADRDWHSHYPAPFVWSLINRRKIYYYEHPILAMVGGEELQTKPNLSPDDFDCGGLAVWSELWSDF